MSLPAPRKLRPRSLAELLDVGLALYRDNFLHFASVAALVNLPLGLVTALLTSLLFSGTVFSATDLLTETGSIRSDTLAAGVVGAVTLALLSAAASLFSTAALLYSAHARLAGLKPGVVDVYRESLPRVPALLGAYILAFLALIGVFLPGAILVGVGAFLLSQGGGGAVAGGIALILLGLALLVAAVAIATLFYIRWLFFQQAAVLETYGPASALGRSGDLVRDRWWKTLGFTLLLALLTTALRATPDAIAGVPVAIFSGTGGQPTFLLTLINSAVNTVTAILILPISVIAPTLLYFDHRVRREALDLEAGVAELELQGARV